MFYARSHSLLTGPIRRNVNRHRDFNRARNWLLIAVVFGLLASIGDPASITSAIWLTLALGAFGRFSFVLVRYVRAHQRRHQWVSKNSLAGH